MGEKILWKENTMPKSKKDGDLDFFSMDEINKARNFHKSFPEYSVTPLVNLENLSEKLGLGGIYLKDESYRFGLNAFKVLGGSYSMGKY
ncbi:diaminopropionate ammonia-lyase, partial [Clostridium perfringens]|nr:diaminopropionate ammonia-lyase [Clostridium perfringens]